MELTVGYQPQGESSIYHQSNIRVSGSRGEGQFDEPRPGAAHTVTDDKVEAVIIKTFEEKPAVAEDLVDNFG